MTKTERLNPKVLVQDKAALQQLADSEGEPMAVVLRRLIRQAARERGLWPAEQHTQVDSQRVSDGRTVA